MRAGGMCGVLACVLLAGAAPAPAPAQDTCSPARTLGVSRTIEIDTTSGPGFGFQFHDNDPLLADGEVVLTFDDGPLRSYTRPVLDALAAQCTKATFFMVGRMAVADPDMAREVERRGHTVGTHTWSHANLGRLTPLKARAEIELGFSAVQQSVGKTIAPFFRFPYLSQTKSLLTYFQNRHVGAFSIDIDSKDYLTRDPAAVHRLVMSQLMARRKGIILFHDIQPSTARALPGLLAELKAKGFRVVHVKPKGHLDTVAEFDAMAQQEVGRRRLAVSDQPLIKRSLTWPSMALPKQPAATAQAPVLRPQPRAPDDGNWVTKIWQW